MKEKIKILVNLQSGLIYAAQDFTVDSMQTFEMNEHRDKHVGRKARKVKNQTITYLQKELFTVTPRTKL